MSRGPDGPNCPACAWPDDTHGACAHHEAPPPLGGTFWAEAMSLAAGQAYERGRVAGLAEAASVVRAEALGCVLPGVDAEHATADDARRALPGVLRATLDGLDDLADDARGAHVATGNGHRDVAALHRTTRESCRALAFELHAAARVARVPIAAAQPRPQRLRVGVTATGEP